MSGDMNFETYLSGSATKVDSKEQLKYLSQELDCLGLPAINVNVDVLQQLVSSIYKLISLYRKNITQQNELQLKTTLMQSEIISQQKLVAHYKDKLDDKETEIKILKDTIRKQKVNISDLQKEKNTITKDLNALKCLFNREEEKKAHTMMKLQLENETLKERLGEEFGKYKSQDSLVAETVSKYKIKMGIYEDTITKLQSNNEALLNEILNLKEEIVMTLRKAS